MSGNLVSFISFSFSFGFSLIIFEGLISSFGFLSISFFTCFRVIELLLSISLLDFVVAVNLFDVSYFFILLALLSFSSNIDLFNFLFIIFLFLFSSKLLIFVFSFSFSFFFLSLVISSKIFGFCIVILLSSSLLLKKLISVVLSSFLGEVFSFILMRFLLFHLY